jgi:hypothetical protein
LKKSANGGFWLPGFTRRRLISCTISGLFTFDFIKSTLDNSQRLYRYPLLLGHISSKRGYVSCGYSTLLSGAGDQASAGNGAV